MYVRVQRGEAFPKMLHTLNKCCQPTNRVLEKGDKNIKRVSVSCYQEKTK